MIMNELFTLIVTLLGTTGANDFCESMFWNTQYNSHEVIIEACEETVWQETFYNSYNK